MRSVSRMAAFAAGIAFLSVGAAFCGEDPLKAAPDMYRLVMENDRVRVMEVTFKPGQKIAEHSHPDHFVYVLDAGTLQIHKPDGSASDAALKVGNVLWIPAETHWAVNVGTTTARLLVTELKEPAPMSKGKKSK